MFLTLLVALLSLVGLMVIHEFGHFILAKCFGTDVEEFGIGYPPRLFGKKIGGTLYSLNLIPFGAFVSIKGEKGGVEDYRSFIGKPIWQRAAIVLGGVASFWVVAAIILSIMSGVWGLPTEVSDEADGNLVNSRVKITYLAPDSPAAEAGLQVGDTILHFDRIKEVQAFVEEHKGESVVLSVERGSETIEKTMVPRISHPKDQGPLGIEMARVALKPYPWYEAPVQGVRATYQLTASIISNWIIGLKSLLGFAPLPEGMKMEMFGPVGILDLMREYVSLGANNFLLLVSFISIALALANILPIPALDGGKLIFLGIEAVRGRPVNHRLEQRITGAFFILLIILMIFVTVKFDIPRLF